MAHYINAEQLKAELDKRYTEYRAKMKTDDFTYYEGMADALDFFEQYIDSLPEQPVEGLDVTDFCKPIDPGIAQCVADHWWKMIGEESTNKKPVEELEEEIERFYRTDEYRIADTLGRGFETLARHFAEWGARHSINWGDVQLLDTFILELSREEKDGTDWGDSEKFYTEVLRRFHEFNDKKISEIVAEWGAEHARKEE